MPIRSLISCTSVAILVTAIATPTRAAECPPAPATPAAREAQARRMFDDAIKKEAADPEGALHLYGCTSALSNRASVALRIAYVSERLQRLTEAADAFEKYLELAGEFAPDAAELRARITALRARAATPPPAPATAPSPPNGAPTAAANRTPERPEPSPAPASGSRTWAWISLAAGGALAATGGALVVAAGAKSDDVHALPEGTPWSSDRAQQSFESAQSQQTIGLVVGAIGLAAIGASVVMFALSGKSSSGAASTAAASSTTLRLRW